MDTIQLGRRVRCATLKPIDGTIVRATTSRVLQGGHASCYDVVWDDGTCTKALSAQELQRPEWLALPEMRSLEACNELRYRLLLAQARERAHQPHRPVPADHAPAPRAARPAAAASRWGLPRVARPSDAPPPTREITQRAREALAAAGIEATISTAYRVAGNVLQVAWMDGPVPAEVHSRLSSIQRSGAVARIELARSASTHTLRCLVRYLHQQFYRAQDLQAPSPALAHVLQAVTPEAYLGHDLTAVWPPTGHRHSGLCYQDLLRSAFEHWDGRLQRFVDTEACRHMLAENAALFPNGYDAATSAMQAITRNSRIAADEMDEVLGTQEPEAQRCGA